MLITCSFLHVLAQGAFFGRLSKLLIFLANNIVLYLDARLNSKQGSKVWFGGAR